LELFRAEGHFARTQGRDDSEVLVLAPSEPRRRRTAAAARQVVVSDRWDAYLFATRDILGRARFAAS
jgi:hypothetical protein